MKKGKEATSLLMAVVMSVSNLLSPLPVIAAEQIQTEQMEQAGEELTEQPETENESETSVQMYEVLLQELDGYRSTQNAIAQCYKMAQLQNLHFVVDVDIVGFFDNIDHSKLIRQLWGLGIQDRKLIMIIKQMLKAEILFNDIVITPETGTPQGGFYPHFLQM